MWGTGENDPSERWGRVAIPLLSIVSRGEHRSSVARLFYIATEAANLGFYVKYSMFKYLHLIYMNTHTQSISQIKSIGGLALPVGLPVYNLYPRTLGLESFS